MSELRLELWVNDKLRKVTYPERTYRLAMAEEVRILQKEVPDKSEYKIYLFVESKANTDEST